MRMGILACAVLALASFPALGDEKERQGDVYTLDHCVVSGEKLDARGKPVVHVHEGREIRFCCPGCVQAFNAEPAKFIEKADQAMIAQQRDLYPVENCVIMPEDEIDPKLDFVYNNRLIRVCCRDCIKDFNEDPAKYVAMIDKAVVEKQKADYPLDTCVVSGEKLGSHGEPVEYVAGNRLVRLCCKACEKPLEAEPAKFLAKIDEAR